MRLLEVTLRREPGTVSLVGTVRRGDREFELYFRYPEWCEGFLRPNADPFLAAMSVPAAEAGEELSSDLPASPDLLRGLTHAVEVLHTWHPDRLGPLRLDVPLRTQELAKGPDHAASFFSCGVDSFDTVLQNLWHPAPGNPPLRYALFVHGLETELDKEVGAAGAAERSFRVAAALGLGGIVGWTNIRTHFPLNYGGLYCGVALCATALSLAGGCSVVFLPASRYNPSGRPLAHHILIDESCSTRYLRLETDGGDVTRTQKVARSVARSELALENLRSCSTNRGALENCGTCPKCLQTMMSLQIAGVLGSSATFPRTLRPDVLEVLNSREPGYMHINARALRETGRSPWMAHRLERRARGVIRGNALRAYLETSPFRGLLEAWRGLKNTKSPWRTPPPR